MPNSHIKDKAPEAMSDYFVGCKIIGQRGCVPANGPAMHYGLWFTLARVEAMQDRTRGMRPAMSNWIAWRASRGLDYDRI